MVFNSNSKFDRYKSDMKLTLIHNLLSLIVRLLCISLLLIICLPAADENTELPSVVRIYGFGTIIFLFVFSVLISGLKPKNLVRLSLPWFALFFACFVPAAINNASIQVFSHVVLIYLIYFIVLPNTPINFQDLALSTSLLNVYLSYRCFFEMDIFLETFYGTASNSNQFALFLIGGVIGAIYLFVSNQNIIIKIYAILTLAVSVVLVAFSSSRTVMVSIVIMVLYSIKFLLSERKAIFSKTFTYGILILSILYLLITYQDAVYTFLFSKWNSTSDDMSSGRVDIWLNAFENISFGGDFNSTVNANSEFINHLILFGIFPYIAYTSLIIICLFKSWKIYKRERSADNLFCFYIVASYSFMSIFENFYSTFGQSINIMFWMALSHQFYYQPLSVKKMQVSRNKVKNEESFYSCPCL